MKFSRVTLSALLLSSASVEGFVGSSIAATRPDMRLEAQKDKRAESLGAVFTAAVVGWSFASQMAFASVASPNGKKTSTTYPRLVRRATERVDSFLTITIQLM